MGSYLAMMNPIGRSWQHRAMPARDVFDPLAHAGRSP